MKLNIKLSNILKQIGFVLNNYTMVVVMAIAMTMFSILKNNMNNSVFQDGEIFMIKIIYLSSLGISLMFAIKMFAQRFGRQYLLEFLGTIFLVSLYFILPDNKDQYSIFQFFLLIILPILTHLLVAFVPFTHNKNERYFWEYNKKLLLNFLTSILFMGILLAGVCLALLAVSHLFDISIVDRFYLDIFLFFMIFGSTVNFLLLCKEGLPFLEKPCEYPLMLKFFTQFILIPLLLIYLLILYAYSAKILLAWYLPRGWVSYMIMAYTIVGLLAILLVHPLKGKNSKSWVMIFSKIFFYSIIPLLVLLFVAIQTRIVAYGYTEKRYFVVLLAIWLTTLVVYFIFYKKQHIKFIPISLFCFIIFGMFFPYFNAFSSSIRSQENHLLSFLNENQLLVNGKINFNKEISDEKLDELDERTLFLIDRNETQMILSLIDKRFLSVENDDDLMYLSHHFKNVADKNIEETTMLVTLETKEAIDIEHYKYIIKDEKDDYKIGNDSIFISEDEDAVILNGKEKFYFLKEIEKIAKTVTPIKSYELLPSKQMQFKFKLGNYDMKFILESVTIEYDKSDLSKVEVFSYSGFVLVK